jgi:hypothetical protein
VFYLKKIKKSLQKMFEELRKDETDKVPDQGDLAVASEQAYRCCSTIDTTHPG